MRRNMWRMGVFVLGSLFVLAALAACPAYARAATVVYDGTQKAWHAEELQDGDLFMEFGGVMPGDALEHEFELRLDRPSDRVALYVALECQHPDEELFSQIAAELTVDGRAVVSGTLADVLGGSVPVGVFTDPYRATIQLRLQVPTSLDNAYQHEVYPISWRFIAQDEGSEGGSSAGSGDLIPQTGDDARIWFAVPAVAGAAAVAVGLRQRARA